MLRTYFYKQKITPVGKEFYKYNFLISFFKNLGYTIDNLTPIPIVKEDIEELLDRCNKVLKNPDLAKKLLPTEEGSLDYDELYFYKVKTLRQYIIDNLLPEFNNLDLNEAIMFEIWF